MLVDQNILTWGPQDFKSLPMKSIKFHSHVVAPATSRILVGGHRVFFSVFFRGLHRLSHPCRVATGFRHPPGTQGDFRWSFSLGFASCRRRGLEDDEHEDVRSSLVADSFNARFARWWFQICLSFSPEKLGKIFQIDWYLFEIALKWFLSPRPLKKNMEGLWFWEKDIPQLSASGTTHKCSTSRSELHCVFHPNICAGEYMALANRFFFWVQLAAWYVGLGHDASTSLRRAERSTSGAFGEPKFIVKTYDVLSTYEVRLQNA